MHQRATRIVISGVVGGLFAVGLFRQGPVGGGLLLITVAILIVLAMSNWGAGRPQTRALRIAAIALIAAIAVAKIVR
jgi:hypothetical protein